MALPGAADACHLLTLCVPPQDLLSRTNGEIPVLASSLLEVSCREMGVALTREQLQQGCATALQAIHEGKRNGKDRQAAVPQLCGVHCTVQTSASCVQQQGSSGSAHDRGA